MASWKTTTWKKTKTILWTNRITVLQILIFIITMPLALNCAMSWLEVAEDVSFKVRW